MTFILRFLASLANQSKLMLACVDAAGLLIVEVVVAMKMGFEFSPPAQTLGLSTKKTRSPLTIPTEKAATSHIASGGIRIVYVVSDPRSRPNIEVDVSSRSQHHLSSSSLVSFFRNVDTFFALVE